MKLKQADKVVVDYPSRYNFKPVLLGVGAAMVLAGCANKEVKAPSALGGAVIASSAPRSQQGCKVPVKSKKEEANKEEIKEPENLGGITPVEPPPEPKKNWR